MSILKPGFNEVDIETYHADRTHYSSSALKLLLKNRGKFYKKYILNEAEEEAVNHNFTFGNYVHTLLLEPHLVDKEFTTFSGSKNTAEFKAFVAENQGKTILTRTAWQNGQYLAETARKSKNYEYIKRGEPEKTFCGKIQGVPIKVRADLLGGDFVLDIKTTSTNVDNLYNIERACANYGYALSAALYYDMFKRKQKGLSRFLFWFINKQSGSDVMVQASDEFLDYGRSQYKKAIKIYHECMETGIWEDDIPKINPLY